MKFVLKSYQYVKMKKNNKKRENMQAINKSWYDNSHSLKSVNLYLLFTYDLSFRKSHGKNKKYLKFSFCCYYYNFR